MDQKEFKRRRKQLMNLMEPGDIAILPSAPIRLRNRDVEYRYRPDSDFYYVTGFPEPEAVAVLKPGRAHGEYVLFCRERDPEMELWNGKRAGQDGACELYGADDSFPINDIDDILPGMLENTNRVFYTMGCDRDFDQHLIEWVNRLKKQSRAGIHAPGEFVGLDHLLHEMRLIKSAAEIKLMRKAAQLAARAHQQAQAMCKPGMNEREIEAAIRYEFLRHGATEAYPAIVAGGENACILHYTENNQKLRDGDLLLIDAGCEMECYASDITRTFPVNGEFSKEQQRVHDIVAAAQAAAIDEVRPGKHWNDPHHAAVRVITEGLLDIGILKGKLGTLIKNEAYKPYYMHRTGHWLGMDVHDVGEYKLGDAWRLLEPGMVMTVEPGIYIAPEAKVGKKWRGIGVRIEDDVVVTAKGVEVLSRA